MDRLSTHQARGSDLRAERALQEAELRSRLADLDQAARAVREMRSGGTSANSDLMLEDLLEREKEAGSALSASRDALAATQKRLDQLVGLKISDPRRRLEGLSDELPILLFPVRIETRFFLAGDDSELRVRIFPDEILISSHEKTLTAGEAADGLAFWKARAEALQLSDVDGRARTVEGLWTGLAYDHGEPRAAYVVMRTRPENWDDASPPDPASLVFPDLGPERPATHPGALPRSRVMPDRFVIRVIRGREHREVLGNPVPDDLLLGPDPKQIEAKLERDQATGKLKPDARLKWVFDFDEAEKIGLGIRVPIPSEEDQKGFDRLIVLGLKLSSDPMASAKLVEDLIESHRYTGGFDLVPQGTPTNNTERVPSGFSSDSRPSPTLYERLILGKAATSEPDPTKQTDAETLARAIGIKFDAVRILPYALQMDIAQGRTMNRALWSATIGGYLRSIVPSALPRGFEQMIRRFFIDHVSGRGAVPAVRAARQPYGVLVTSSLDEWMAPASRLRGDFPNKLLSLLKSTYGVWRSLARSVPRVTRPDPDHRSFMAAVGLQASSDTYGARKGVGDFAAWNWLEFNGHLRGYSQKIWSNMTAGRSAALSRLGFDPAQPDLKLGQLIWLEDSEPLDGPVVDMDPQTPLSETARITPYDPATKQNYIHWLATAPPGTIQAHKFVRADGTNAPAPKALLYKYLRHSLLADAANTSSAFVISKVPAIAALAQETEADTFNIGRQRTLDSAQLLEANARSLGLARNDLHLGAYVLDRARLGIVHDDDPPELSVSADLSAALAALADLPTAALERLFAEHIDLGSYRLDAWITGLFNERLQQLRSLEDNSGVAIGAYGYVEMLKPREDDAVGVDLGELPPELQDGDGPIISRGSNAGFVHAPSLTHGVTAAVLRAAYLSHADRDRPTEASVNLSSRRVRMAMDFVEGIRNGQELGALLGYQLERGLHEKHAPLELDEYIYVLRDRFPFISRKISTAPGDASSEVIEARNVVNGYDLIAWTDNRDYPYGIAGLPGAALPEAKAIIAEIDRLKEAFDALGDLMLAESVHQVVQGDYDRARGVLQAMGDGEVPPVPDVVATPRSGTGIVQRIVIHCAAGPGWTGNPPATPRAAAAPRLNHWLASQLPAPSDIRMTFTVGGTAETVSMANIGLDAIDVALMCSDPLGQGASVLERWIVDWYRATRSVPSELPLRVRLGGETVSGEGALLFDLANAGGGTAISLESAWPYLTRLGKLVTGARALDASDLRPSTTEYDLDNPKGFEGSDPALSGQKDYADRVDGAITELAAAAKPLGDVLDAVATKARIDSLFAEPPVFVAADWAADLSALRTALRDLVQFGLGEAIPGISIDPVSQDDAQQAAKALVEQAQVVRALAEKRVAEANAALVPPAGTPGSETAAQLLQARIDRLGRALRIVLGGDMPLTPLFELPAAQAADLASAASDPVEPDPQTIETWLESLSRVRERASTLAWVSTIRDWLIGSPVEMAPLQTPREPGDAWIGSGAAPKSTDVLSVMVVTPPADPTIPLSGLMIDDWSELVPGDTETTGVAFHFDRPNACAPQALLLAVSPTLDGAWEWNDLMSTVIDTFERAKVRLVEPDQLVGTDYFQALPTTMVEFSSRPFLLSTLLATNSLTVASPGS